MLDQILEDLEAHCERIVTRLDDIERMCASLRDEEKALRAELKTGAAVFTSAKKTIDRAVEKHGAGLRLAG